MNETYNFHGIDLILTCGGCPESYSAYKDGLYAGSLHLRYGHFTVDIEADNSRWIGYPKGDGIFEYDEREYYLEKACKILSICAL